MNAVKKTLLSLLGEKNYLSLLAGLFQKLYRLGLPGKDYQDIYFLRQIIGPGSICVDIGAHLGYYTCELSRLAGITGKIYAIEPISKFNKTLEHLLHKKNIINVVLYQVALGGDEDYVEMGIPRVNNLKKFAYARIMKSSSHLEYMETEKVKNESGDHLFKELPRLDFIKCDVEGLEVSVFSSMMQVVETHRPMLLCELGDKKDRIRLYEMLLPAGYSCYILKNKKLYPLDIYSDATAISHNHYFITGQRKNEIKHLFGNNQDLRDNNESIF
jgi:FkbM family methyltransferase